MNPLKLTTCLIPLLVFVGCGQNFKANSEKLKKAEQSVDSHNLNVPEGKTPKSKDQEILNTYMSEFEGLDDQSIQSVISDIRSFEVQVNREQNRVHSVSVKMHARTNAVDNQGTSITACNNLIEVSDSQITLTRLQSQNSVFLGRDNDYEFIIQCTDSSCDEMVAAVRRLGNNQGLVLIGLKSQSSIDQSGNSYIQRYVSRSVDIEPYFTVAVSPDEYISIVCSLEDSRGSGENAPVDPSESNGPFGGENTPVDPTGNIPTNTKQEDNTNEDPFWYDGVEKLF